MNISSLYVNTTFLWCFALFAIGPLYQLIGKWRDARRFPAPGRILGGLHILDRGAGPAVLLEAGIAGSSLSWRPVEDRVAKFARVISYDRAGLGWSANSRDPRTLENIARELRRLLRSAGVPGPYILVGHSFGGLVVSYFASQYPEDVAGVLLVDAVPVSDWFPLVEAQKRRLARGVGLSRRGAWLARFGVVRFALTRFQSGSRLLPRLIAKFSAGKGASVMDGLGREIRKLLPEVWPMIQAQWCLPKNFQAMAAYLEALPANAETAATLQIPANIPAIALCSDVSGGALVAGIDYRRVENCGHWIQLDHPDIVAAAIQELIP